MSNSLKMNLRMISCKYLIMEKLIEVIWLKDYDMDEVFKLGPMGQNILENGEKIKYMV